MYVLKLERIWDAVIAYKEVIEYMFLDYEISVKLYLLIKEAMRGICFD